MSEADENKDLIRRYQEAYNSNDLDVLDEMLAPDWTTNNWPVGVPQSIEQAKQFHNDVALQVFPDMQFVTQDLFAEGDRVAQRHLLRGTHKGEFMGLPPTGRVIETGGVSIFRIADSRIVEHWAFADELGFFHQIGADVPEPWLVVGHRST
jgi:steroid delta-isomerase-like uncharacterized protein